MLQKLGDLVTDLYLAEGKAKDRLWKRLAAALKNLKIPDDQIQHIVRQRQPHAGGKSAKKAAGSEIVRPAYPFCAIQFLVK